MIGKTISHCRMVEKLGEGGMDLAGRAKDMRDRRAAYFRRTIFLTLLYEPIRAR